MVKKRIQAPKQYTENEFALKRAEAKALFLSGKNPSAIDQILELRSGRAIQWAHKYNWAEERDGIMEITTKTRLQELLAEHEEIIGELKTIREKAFDPIFTDAIRPKKFSEASNSYMNAVETLRKLRTDTIHESFMNDLIQACREIIQDQDLLFRLGTRFKEIYNGHQLRQIDSGTRMIEGKIEDAEQE